MARDKKGIVVRSTRKEGRKKKKEEEEGMGRSRGGVEGGEGKVRLEWRERILGDEWLGARNERRVALRLGRERVEQKRPPVTVRGGARIGANTTSVWFVFFFLLLSLLSSECEIR